MNSVHLMSQEKYRVEKLGRKPSRVHEHPTGPACAHRPRAQRQGCAHPAPACRAPRAPSVTCSARLRLARLASLAPHARAPAASRSRAPSCLQRPLARPRTLVLRAPSPRLIVCLRLLRARAARQRPLRPRLLRPAPCRDTTACLATRAALSHATIQCSVLQYTAA